MTNCLTTLALTAVVGMACAGLGRADQWDKKTKITIDETLQLPNMTLQPGTYVIRLADSVSNRHVVQFFDKDEKQVVTTILAIPNERLRPTGKSVFSFWEVPAGQPKALRAWFYPGDNFGQEFAYPKAEAARITANNTGQTVPESEEKPVDLATSVPVESTAKESATAIVLAEPAPAPTPVAVEVAQQTPAPVVVQSAPVTDSDAQRRLTRTAPEELPKTASNEPLFALVGLLSIAGALALKLRYQRG